MKTITTLCVTSICVLFSCSTKAQNNCTEMLSLFADNIKAKRYTEAAPQLDALRKNCATFNYGIYVRGELLLRAELKKANDKKSAALELIQLYKERLQLFPAKTPKGIFLPKIAEAMYTYQIGTISEQYKLFDEAFTKDLENFKNPRSLYYYFELYYTMYTSTSHNISLEELIEKHDAVANKLALEKKQSKKNSKAIDAFSKNMEVLIEKEATCETLVPMFEKKFQTNKANIEWIRKAARKLDAKGCKDVQLFIDLVEAIDTKEPNANSKLYLYRIHEQKGHTEKAATYFKQYLTLETDLSKKAIELYKIGNKTVQKRKKATARSYYLEAIKANPNHGRSYLAIAKLYASSANACGTDEFTKKATYWKAAVMARKAANADSSIKKEANEWAERYMSLAPNKPAIFSKGYKGGEKIDMKCWIGGFVVVPKL